MIKLTIATDRLASGEINLYLTKTDIDTLIGALHTEMLEKQAKSDKFRKEDKPYLSDGYANWAESVEDLAKRIEGAVFWANSDDEVN